MMFLQGVSLKKNYNTLSKHRMNENNILCGDFNCKMHNIADKSVRYLKDLKEHFNLDDTCMWEKLNQEMTGFTWCDAKNDPKSRIDQVFINTSFHYKLTSIKNGKIPGTHSNGSRMSDPRFLKNFYDIDKTKRRPGYWKLNVSYFENENYKKGIIDRSINTSLSPTAAWELIKRKVKGYFINFAKYKQKNKVKIKSIEHEISEVRRKRMLKYLTVKG